MCCFRRLIRRKSDQGCIKLICISGKFFVLSAVFVGVLALKYFKRANNSFFQKLKDFMTNFIQRSKSDKIINKQICYAYANQSIFMKQLQQELQQMGVEIIFVGSNNQSTQQKPIKALIFNVVGRCKQEFSELKKQIPQIEKIIVLKSDANYDIEADQNLTRADFLCVYDFLQKKTYLTSRIKHNEELAKIKSILQ